MDGYQDFSSYSLTDGQLTNNEISNAYQALSSPASFEDIDTNDEISFVYNCIENLFDSKFKLLNSEDIVKNSILLNNKFVELIKYCKQNHNYKKVGYIFIGFCNYFDIDESLTYKNLHEKLQMLIKQAAIKMCGKDIFRKNSENIHKNKEIQVTTLFSLTNK